MTNKSFLYLFNTIILFNLAVLIFVAFQENIAATLGCIVLLGTSLFFRSVIKADIDEDEERSKQHKGL